MSWVPVAPAAEIPPGDYATVELESGFVAVFNVDGEFFAIDDVGHYDSPAFAAAMQPAVQWLTHLWSVA